MAQDVVPKAQIAQIRTGSSQCTQGFRLPLFELTDRVTVFLQFLGRGAHQLCRLLVGQRAIHGVLAQLLGGALEVFDGLSIGRLLVFQRGVLGDGGPAFVPGIARPEPDHQR